MKKFLRDYPAHLEAFKDTLKKFPNHDAGYLPTFFFVTRLSELDEKAVYFFPSWQMARRFPESDFSVDGVFYVFLYPSEDDDCDLDELPGDICLEWQVLAVDSSMVHGKDAAAEWSGVGIRTFQRWIKGTQNREPLPGFKCGDERVFLEADLWRFMQQHAVGTRWQFFPEYRPGDARPIPTEQDFLDNFDTDFPDIDEFFETAEWSAKKQETKE